MEQMLCLLQPRAAVHAGGASHRCACRHWRQVQRGGAGYGTNSAAAGRHARSFCGVLGDVAPYTPLQQAPALEHPDSQGGYGGASSKAAHYTRRWRS